MEKNGNLGHLELIRKINRTLILNMVKEKQPISRAQISKALNLSKTTVSAIVDELIKKKLLVEYGDCMSPSGLDAHLLCWDLIQNLRIVLAWILAEQNFCF
ncbi:MarR family transcriptional regulator [Clostridium sp. AM48-13]|uniref:MarR family transcriptional regulator n=1 Tax=Clostridium sp. AM48-13 TaxID=2293034 RepID=UPI001FAAFDD0